MILAALADEALILVLAPSTAVPLPVVYVLIPFAMPVLLVLVVVLSVEAELPLLAMPLLVLLELAILPLVIALLVSADEHLLLTLVLTCFMDAPVLRALLSLVEEGLTGAVLLFLPLPLLVVAPVRCTCLPWLTDVDPMVELGVG